MCPLPHPSSFVKVLTPTVTLSGDRAFMEVMKVEEAIRVGSDLIGLVSFKKRHQGSCPFSLSAR